MALNSAAGSHSNLLCVSGWDFLKRKINKYINEMKMKILPDLPRIKQPANVLGAAAEVSETKTGSRREIAEIRPPRVSTIDWPLPRIDS